MSAKLMTLARRWNVDLICVYENAFKSGTYKWQASAVWGQRDFVRQVEGPSREAVLLLLKAEIDEARDLEVLAA